MTKLTNFVTFILLCDPKMRNNIKRHYMLHFLHLGEILRLKFEKENLSSNRSHFIYTTQNLEKLQRKSSFSYISNFTSLKGAFKMVGHLKQLIFTMSEPSLFIKNKIIQFLPSRFRSTLDRKWDQDDKINQFRDLFLLLDTKMWLNKKCIKCNTLYTRQKYCGLSLRKKIHLSTVHILFTQPKRLKNCNKIVIFRLFYWLKMCD